MTYKLIFLSLLFLLTINNISANQSRRLLETVTPDEQETAFDNTENTAFDDETEATEGTEGTDETEGTETDTIDDNGEDNGEDDGEYNGEDDNETGDDGDVEDNDEDAELDDIETTQSADGTDSQNDDLLTGSLDDIDPCIGLELESCGTTSATSDEEGDPLCSFNDIKDECFESVRKDGRFGSGNYDDGYNAAQQKAVDDHNDLYQIIGILGALIGVLVLIIVGGIYWMCRKKSTKPKRGTMELVDPENDQVAMIQK